MKLKHNPQILEFKTNSNSYSFLKSGNIYIFKKDDIMINGFFGNLPTGSINNIWLRVYNGTNRDFYPLLGVYSNSTLSYNENSIKYSGVVKNISYEVIFAPVNDTWFWTVNLKGENVDVDLVYGQDIGLAETNSLLENELYTAQYLGHTILKNENGYVVCSRQNLPQKNSFPYLQQGMLKGKTIAYSTDAFQFFDKLYKQTNVPKVLSTDLPSKNLQFECSYIGLESEKTTLNGTQSFVFYGIVKSEHTDIVTDIEFTSEIEQNYKNIQHSDEYTKLTQVKIADNFGSLAESKLWGLDLINKRYPTRCHEEYSEGELISFFTPDQSHVVLKQKELIVERPHGNIITTLISDKKIDNNLITSTNYINGIFNSQTVIGNTSMNKLLSVSRGLLDFFKTSGQRILIKINEQCELLSLPSVFEMGLNYSRWYYDLNNDIIEITSFAKSDSTEIVLEVKSENNISYDFIITNKLVMGKHEYTSTIDMTINNDSIKLRVNPDDSKTSPYPNLNYIISLPNTEFTVTNDSLFYNDVDVNDNTMLCIKVTKQSSFQLNICGKMEEDCSVITEFRNFELEKKIYIEFYDKFMCNFKLSATNINCKSVEKLNTIMFWFAHNALVHYAVPHGLEQSGGAAWGTRDVSQGPFELLLATQNYPLARNVILEIFSHQVLETGEWPQWFMFDKYKDALDECHGDVVFWPLKCVSNYINATLDTSILSEILPYQNIEDKSTTLLAHIELAINSIKNRYLSDTALISYGGGDWDDTLQPASQELKEYLVSSWTQALAYQVLDSLSTSLQSVENDLSSKLKTMSIEIKASFEQYLIIDGIIPGFVYRSKEKNFVPMLHPKDKKTGINYRLLPMTRSIIANLVDVDQARKNFELIENHLHCPDGVRLMDNPAQYNGGKSDLFLRAERAANVGREVSLQYTHAHIRYIEALCHMGYGSRAWKALFEINPINLKDTVPRSLPRQSNHYFTSSEGVFADRYEYARDFRKLKDGTIDVKGGWRLYSSGPGIYIKNVIESILGIKFKGNNLIIDPVLDLDMNNSILQYRCFNSLCNIHYHIQQGSSRKVTAKIKDIEITNSLEDNPYRTNGVLISKDFLQNEKTDIHVYITLSN